MAAPPEVLFFKWPGAQNDGCGEYWLQAERANGMPLWRWAGTGSERWLYSGANGKWFICVAAAKEQGFQCSLGFFASAAPHGGAHPPAVQGWEWFDKTTGSWIKAEDVEVLTEAPTPPEVLSVKWPGAKVGVAGEYQLQAELANGMPVWRRAGAGSDWWLYSGLNGWWFIGSAASKEKDFQCSAGWIASATRHGGAHPAAVHGWEYHDSDKGAYCKADKFEVLAVLTKAEAKAAEEAAKKARADAKDPELKTLVSQDDAAMREVNAKCDSAIKELEAMSAKYESTSKELKAMSTKYDSAREELEAMSAKLEAISAKYDSASKELERIAAAGQPANARGSALAAARAGHGAEERLAALEAVLDELQVDAGMLKDGASFRRWMAQHGYVKEQKFEARALKFGRSTEAAAGIEALIGMDEDDLHDKARGGLAAMRAEFEANGGPEDKANFKYVVEGVAQDKQWLPDHVKADIQKGQYHGGPLEPGDYDRNHSGMTLKDFVESLEAKVSKLKEHHIAALRLYTTSSYRKLNAPFRDRAPLPHPFAVTVYFLAQGLKKLRTVQAEIDPEGFAAESTLWRGLSNATIDLEAFKREGGTELAPMSTSSDRSVAAKYAASQSPLILRYKAKGLTRGVSLKFLSVYPKEEEFLYPPGTFLSFGGVEEIDGVSIVTVEPVMA